MVVICTKGCCRSYGSSASHPHAPNISSGLKEIDSDVSLEEITACMDAMGHECPRITAISFRRSVHSPHDPADATWDIQVQDPSRNRSPHPKIDLRNLSSTPISRDRTLEPLGCLTSGLGVTMRNGVESSEFGISHCSGSKKTACKSQDAQRFFFPSSLISNRS
jgi:hypothetical protein